MRINMMPLFAWHLLIVAGMILFAFPSLSRAYDEYVTA
jgi:cytochrome c oxidase subunit I+III